MNSYRLNSYRLNFLPIEFLPIELLTDRTSYRLNFLPIEPLPSEDWYLVDLPAWKDPQRYYHAPVLRMMQRALRSSSTGNPTMKIRQDFVLPKSRFAQTSFCPSIVLPTVNPNLGDATAMPAGIPQIRFWVRSQNLIWGMPKFGKS